MKLKFEPVNGYGVLVDEKAEIKEGDYIFNFGDIFQPQSGVKEYYRRLSENLPTDKWSKIIFTEPEHKLEGVPVFQWRDFEVEKLAESYCQRGVKAGYESRRLGFIQGYKSNPAKYTEEDLRKAIQEAWSFVDHDDEVGWVYYKNEDQIIQALQKYPKYVVMEYINDYEEPEGDIHIPKLFTNSEGKPEGTVKELIWT
jgi:hypothetical protein